MELVRKHMAQDPKRHAQQRSKRHGRIASVLGAVIGAVAFVILLKGFVIALHGPDAYGRLIAPMVAGADDGSAVQIIFGADPVSREIAALLRPFVSDIAPTGPLGAVAPPVSDSAAPDL